MPAIDFQKQLGRQIQFIENSCREFDIGQKDEAIRISTALRIIFHDTKSSTSVLSHLHCSTLNMLSTSLNTKPNETHPFAIVVWKGIAGQPDSFHSAPLLDEAPSKKFIPRQEWWDSEIIFRSLGVTITRRKLVLYAANQDGGAHVDATLDADYERLIEGMGVTLTFTDVDETTKLPKMEPMVLALRSTHLAALRQIAYEALNTPELMSLAGR